MSAALPPSAQRVQAVLQSHGLSLRVREMPDSTRTAEEAAAAVGCPVGAIVKSLIFRAQTTDRPVLVLTSGAHRVDTARVAEHLGEPVGKADAAFVRQHTGFAIGGVPPVGHATPPVTLVDPELLAYDTLWAAAGTPHAVFALTPADLRALTGGEVVPVR